MRRLEAQQDEQKRTQLARSQWVFPKNPQRHSEQELARLEQMDWQHPLTVRACQMRLILQDLYQLPAVKQARKDFVRWRAWVKTAAAKAGHQLLQPMLKIAEMVERHGEGILGDWKAGLTTAYLEGLNSRFSATK
ncbi:MAG: transposase [Verrucomicrobia bacterium]|nr:transposase [Verrucomicrobiota bacterium]